MKIYTIKEVAKALRVSERQVYRYLKAGELGGSLKGKWRFTDADIKKFLASGQKKPKN